MTHKPLLHVVIISGKADKQDLMVAKTRKLKKEMERLILAAQDQALRTNRYKVRLEKKQQTSSATSAKKLKNSGKSG